MPHFIADLRPSLTIKTPIYLRTFTAVDRCLVQSDLLVELTCIRRSQLMEALYESGCSSGRSARLFPGERDGRRLAQGNAYANRSQQGSYKDEPPTLAIDTSINARAASS